MSKRIWFHPPRLRIFTHGIHWVRPSVSMGGKGIRVNVSSQGPSVTVGGPDIRVNTRRGCLFSPLAWLFGHRR